MYRYQLSIRSIRPRASWSALALLLVSLVLPGLTMAAGDDDCATPPGNMVGWWPFDENVGGSTAVDTVIGNDGNYVGSPLPDFGRVGGGITVDTQSPNNDFVEIPHHADYNFGTGDFSIDAWVKPTGLGTFLSKHDGTTGWELRFDLISNLHLFVKVEGAGGGISGIDCGVFPGSLSNWYHVAVTVDRSADEIRCFANGSWIGTVAGPITGSVDNTATVKVGKGAGTFGADFAGIIDELELFDAEISDAEIAEVAGAGAFGKCKDGGYAPWDKPFCKRAGKITVPASVCNYHTSTQSYVIDSLAPLPTSFHQQCNIPGPTGFQVLTSSVNVPPGQCRNMYIRVNRPAAMISAATIGCYEITFENSGNGNQFSRAASVWDTRDRCTTSTLQDVSLADIRPGVREEIIFQVQNTGGERDVPIEIRIEPADMEEGNTLIRLNDLEVDQPVRGVLEFRGSEAEVAVSVEAVDYDPFRFFNITLVAYPGEGEREEILDSVGVRAVPEELDPIDERQARK